MTKFFDVLLYVPFFVVIPLIVFELIRFPVWVGEINIAKNKKGKPIERFLENAFFMLEGRIILTVVLCAAVSIVSLLLGSFPKEIETPGLLISIPILLMFILPWGGGLFLGKYFLNIARKHDIFKKTDQVRATAVRVRAQYGVGAFIGFYFGIVVSFPLLHLMFILNLF